MSQSKYPRINLSALGCLNTEVSVPSYVPSDHGVGIVHIGIGAFHRGHQAVFTEHALANTGGDWRIVGVSLRSPKVSQQLNPQDGFYTVVERSDSKVVASIVGSIKEVVNAQEDTLKLIDYLSQPASKIVTLTVTEKGYHFDQSAGAINWQNPDIQHDVLHPYAPKTMPGYLVLACMNRMQSEHSLSSKLTVISCDNLPENGRVVESVVRSLAAKLDINLLAWISHNVTFCSSMVDRIVPSVTEKDIQDNALSLGYIDHGLVITEPFKQWVIEDNFCTPRPDWASAGVLFVDNVSDYEKLKLRTLNGSHSALAYMGVLLGHKWIHQAIRDPLLHDFIRKLMVQETGPTIPKFDGFDLAVYQQQIVQRFLNSDIAYATQQVAMDGSQKLQQRILAPMAELYALGRVEQTRCLMATLVSWIRYLDQVSETGDAYSIADPDAEVLLSVVAEASGDAALLVDLLLQRTSLIPQRLQVHPDFRSTLIAEIQQLREQGLKKYLKDICRKIN